MTQSLNIFLWHHGGHTSESELGTASEAIEQLDNQLDFYDIHIINSDWFRTPYSGVSDADNPSELLDDFAEHVKDNYPEDIHSHHIHLLVFKHTGISSGFNIGAGVGRQAVGDNLGTDEFENQGTVAAANAYTEIYGSIVYGEGEQTFKNTVIHEIVHTLTKHDLEYYSAPGEDCMSGANTDHSFGQIDANGSVSPMVTWYTGESDPGVSDKPCELCFDLSAPETLSSELTFCAESTIMDHEEEIDFTNGDNGGGDPWEPTSDSHD
ncbi:MULTISPECIES: hypothetical protein [Natrialba]|nr:MULTISPECIES: hypothetical protein [Natrialba]